MGCVASRENDQNAVLSNDRPQGLDAAGDSSRQKSMHTLERETEASAAAEFMGVGISKSVVELSMSCANLTRRDRFSQSDPFCVCYAEDQSAPYSFKDPTKISWKELGRTEIIANTPNPEWVGKFLIEYQFEIIQRLRFEVYDCDSSFATSDSSKLDLSKQDFLGSYEVLLSTICSHAQQKVVAELVGGSMLNAPFGSISVKGEEIANTTDEFQFRLKCSGLKMPKGVLSSCNPFIVVSKQNEDGSYVPCLKSEVVVGASDPLFAEVCGPLIRIANGDVCRPLIVKVYSWKHNGKHIYIGETMCTMQMLMELAETAETLPIVNKTEQSENEEPIECGRFGAASCSLKEKASFLDYLHGGLELNFVVAIDYTASNGDPNSPESLHYIPTTGRIANPYISAIRSVASVLEFYDYDRKFPCYGFGAKLTRSGVVDHCFPLSGDDSNNVAIGAEGIIAQYREKTAQLHFSGPTVFSNVVYRAASLAKSLKQTPTQKYVVLMIITDGTINDMDNCIDAIVAASTQPMSVIIVGVGEEDFSGMVKLDSDKKMLKSRTGKLAERDIVQFTAIHDMQKMADQAKGGTLDVHDLVSRDLLAEIPAQVTEYFSQHNLPPMCKNEDNAFSRQGSKTRAAEVQVVREQMAETQMGVIDVPPPQTRHQEEYQRDVNAGMVSANPAKEHEYNKYHREEIPPSMQSSDAVNFVDSTRPPARPMSVDRDEWYDATEDVKDENLAALLPSYSTILRDDNFNADMDFSEGRQSGDAPGELLPTYSAVLRDDDDEAVEIFSASQPAELSSQPLPAGAVLLDAGGASDGEDEWFEADDDA